MTVATLSPEPKPCPCCGSRAEPTFNPSRTKVGISCSKCSLAQIPGYDSAAAAVADWNLRAEDSRDAQEGLRGAVRSLLPIGNDQLPGDRVVPIYVRMDELRALHALVAPHPIARANLFDGERDQ